MTRPMTTGELFEKINSILKEKGKLPDILDYSHATSNPVPIRTYEFALGYGSGGRMRRMREAVPGIWRETVPILWEKSRG